jgi:hypothetical protein
MAHSKYKLYIGIDCGNNTGFAVWHSNKKEFLEIGSCTFWESIDKIIEYCLLSNILYDIVFIIEDVVAHSSTFGATKTYQSTQGNHNQKIGAVCKQAERVGSVKDKTTLTLEFLERQQKLSDNLTIKKIPPTKASGTKVSAEYFNKLTGWDKRSNEHGRDAAMLVFGR